jgi:cell wall-associated NlpC family hydrolase
LFIIYHWMYILRISMNLRSAKTICLLLILSSCKSLQQLGSHDNSSNATAASKKGNPQFLDDVSITPGEKKNAGYAYSKSSSSNNKKSLTNKTSFNIEKADWLQIKYAIMMDMPVEQLNNLPLLQQIDHWWGTRYCMGGGDENCIDCSAFTQTILRNVYGVEVPRTAHEQYSFSTRINDDELREGDLVFFKTGKNITHVGLYLGNNKFVNAATSGGVMISDLNESYWQKKYAGGGRVI